MLTYIDKSKIKTNCGVRSIDVEHRKVIIDSGEEICYDRLISSMPFPMLLKMSGVSYEESIYNWNQVLVFNMGFDTKGKDTHSHWIYFPESEYCFYRVGFYSNILSTEKMSLYVEIGFNKDFAVHPEEWIDVVMTDLKKACIVDDEQQLLDYESIVMNPAYVHINSASITDISVKKELLSRNDIYSIGRYGSWTYCSIEDNIKEAKALAEQINKK
jgi:protoporphyrinogen oxidase